MKKIITVFFIVAGLLLGYTGIPAVMGAFSSNADGEEQYEVESALVVDEVKSIAELSSLEFDYTNAAKESDDMEFTKIFKDKKVPLSNKTIVMVYDGKLKLGVNAEDVKIKMHKSLQGEVKSVDVKLPQIQILSHEIDRDSVEYPIQKDSIINKLNTDDMNKIDKKGKQDIEDKLKKTNLYQRAEKELKENIESYLKALFGNEIPINFKEA